MFFLLEAAGEAASNARATAGSSLAGILPLLLFIPIIYFFIIKPQRTRQKQHQEMLQAIKVGDKVLTQAGIIGVISKVVDNDTVVIEIDENVHCRFNKQFIVQIVQ